MAALQCEICGGALLGKPGGIFECEFCGTRYTKEWMKEKVQEIRGTVKVEGTVQVEGTVTVEGNASLNSLLKRGWVHLQSAKDTWRKDATFQEIIDKLKDIDATCAEIYVLQVLRQGGMKSLEDLAQSCYPLAEDENWKSALEYADAAYRAELEAVAQQQAQYCAHWSSMFTRRRAQVRQVRSLIVAANGVTYSSYLAALKSDGSILLKDGKPWMDPVHQWSGIMAIAGDADALVGLRADGTSIFVKCKEADDVDQVTGWTNVHKLALMKHTFGGKTVYSFCGLRDDGELLFSDENRYGMLRRSDVVDIASYSRENSSQLEIAVADGSVYERGYNEWSQKKRMSRNKFSSENAYLRCDDTLANYHCGAVSSVMPLGAFYYLKADGQVYRAERFQYHPFTKQEIPAVAALYRWGNHTAVALYEDGRVSILSDTAAGNRTLPGWKLFASMETLAQERAEAEAEAAARQVREAEAARKAQRQAQLEARRARLLEIKAEAQALQAEYASLKGMFTGKRRKEIEDRLLVLKEEFQRVKEGK